jgi:Lon protease-like protein
MTDASTSSSKAISRFRILRELEVTTPFRQVEAELIVEPERSGARAVERAGFEREARRFADAQGYAWIGISRRGWTICR